MGQNSKLSLAGLKVIGNILIIKKKKITTSTIYILKANCKLQIKIYNLEQLNINKSKFQTEFRLLSKLSQTSSALSIDKLDIKQNQLKIDFFCFQV